MTTPLQRIARPLIPRWLRNWVRAPRHTLAWWRDEWLHLLGRDVMREIRPGWRVRCHPAAYRIAYRLHVEDPEQVAELDAFIVSCRPGMVLVDAGAHFGLVSLAALHFGGPEARAVAVDPAPAAVRMLHIQGRLNAVEDRLTVVRAAVASGDGDLELVDAGVGSSGFYVRPEHSHPAGERTTVPAIAIDTLARRLGAAVTHLKIDVEGFEAEALRGARATLGGAGAPRLFLELHNEIVARNGGDPAESLEILGSLGYQIFGLDGSRLETSAILSRPLIRVVARPGAR